MNEVCLFIRWSDGSETFRRFNTCEEAWLTERTMKKTEASRRAVADRKHPAVSLYAGCTVNGNLYGGILSGYDTRSELETMQKSEFFRRFPNGHRPEPLN